MAHSVNVVDCPVCFESTSDRLRVTTPCGHHFCLDCVLRLQNAQCPLCRQNLPIPNVKPWRDEYVSVPLTIVAHSDDRYSEVRRLRIARPNRHRIHLPLILPEQPSLTDLLSRSDDEERENWTENEMNIIQQLRSVATSTEERDENFAERMRAIDTNATDF